MREIKFRAWNETEEKMFEPFSLYEYVRGSVRNEETLNEGSLLFPIDTLFLQFTGLKDKNGKEIYEGDIIRTKNYEGTHLWLVVNEIDYMGAFSCFTVDCIDKPNEVSSIHARVIDDGEIIGNKFENPELLQ